MASRGGARAHVHVDRKVAAVPDALRGKRDGGLFDDVPTPLFLVDGGNLLWRAAHSHPAPFPAADGRDLTPLFRFITKLRQAVGTYGVFAECIVCFDGADAWSERVELDATYKGNREYESKDLAFMGWLPEIRAALDLARRREHRDRGQRSGRCHRHARHEGRTSGADPVDRPRLLPARSPTRRR